MSNDGPDITTPVESWDAFGLRCAISFGLITFNGYVRIPEGLFTPENVRRVLDASGGITFGPDAEGWVGFDTGHAGDYWAPDDLAEYLHPSALTTANSMRDLAARVSYGKRWTLPLLRDAVEELAGQVSVALAMKDIPQADSPENLSNSLRDHESSE